MDREADRARARARIVELLKAPDDDDDVMSGIEVEELARKLLAGGDPGDQKFLLEQTLGASRREVGGSLAVVLAGFKPHGSFDVAPKRAARPEILRALAGLLEPHHVRGVWQAAVAILFRTDPKGALAKLRPVLSPAAVVDKQTLERFKEVSRLAMVFGPSRELDELVLLTASALPEPSLDRVLTYFLRRGREKDLAHVLEIDASPRVVFEVFRYVATAGGEMKVNPRERKRVLPAVEAVARRLRDDAAARKRLEQADAALELKGALLSSTPMKAPPRIALEGPVGTEGGPLLALPKEALGAWQGVLDPRTGAPPKSGNFKGTDYGRACAVSEGPRQSPWGGYGLLDVGKHKGLVVGQSCSMARLKDGSGLLVMEGDEEEVAAFLQGEPRWEKVPGRLTLPGGALVVFDSAMEKGKTNNKATLKLAPGSYRVEEHHSEKGRSLWMVRLTATHPA